MDNPPEVAMSASIARTRPLASMIAVIAWFGVLLQLYLSLRLTDGLGMSAAWGLAICLGYFTVLTNLLVAVAIGLPLVSPGSAGGRFFARPMAVGWVTASIVFVGVAYYVLLRRVWNPQGLQLLADVLMHYVVPAAMLVFSAIRLRSSRLRWTAPLWWSLYPVGYFIYVLVRGLLMGRYPYPFLDAAQLGYLLVLRNALLLWGAFLLLSYVLLTLWRRLG
jgi:hypothetical protein